MAPTVRYGDTYRRVLLDMHIPDSDPAFLANFDPNRIAATYQRSGVTGAMFYAQSHVGLCYWPTKSGRRHASIGDRDLVDEWLTALGTRGIAACGYYSVSYNNWAAETHPEWRAEFAPRTGGAFPGPRFGVVCPNNPGYRAFLEAQIGELVGGYDLEAIFFDMTYLFPPCQCRHCRDRLKLETGDEIPEIVDWLSPAWTRYQDRRQAWAIEYGEFITAIARAHRSDISVHHNGIAPCDWVFVCPFGGTDANDYLGADFYGGNDEQLVVMKLYDRLSAGHPVEFMTSLCRQITDHVTLKSHRTIESAAFATIGSSAAFLLINGVDPSGEINHDAYQRVGEINRRIAPLEESLGGDPVEDVAIYYSGASKMDFLANGARAESAVASTDYPHYHAVRGVAQALQREHISFGIVTKKQLSQLAEFRLLVLPNVLRMDQEEIDAVRSYVRDGGALYASRYTSLFDTEGKRREDFGLADLFGCHFEADDLAGSVDRASFDGVDMVYLEPTVEPFRSAIAPQRFVAHWPSADARAGAVRLRHDVEGATLGTLALPYGDRWGTKSDLVWASIHSAPPWRRDVAPALVRHAVGQGEVIYSALDLETIDEEANRSLLLAVLQDLVSAPWSVEVEAPESVWLNVRLQPDRERLVVSLVDRSESRSATPLTNIGLRLKPPAGWRFVRAVELPDERDLASEILGDGTLSTTLPELNGIALVAALLAGL